MGAAFEEKKSSDRNRNKRRGNGYLNSRDGIFVCSLVVNFFILYNNIITFG